MGTPQGAGAHQPLRAALRRARTEAPHPAAALAVVARRAAADPDLDRAIVAAMRDGSWRTLVREELCGTPAADSA